MDDTSPARVTDSKPRGALPRGRVLFLAVLGLAAGFGASFFTDGDQLLRYALIPLAAASVGAMLGFVSAVRAARRRQPSQPVAAATPVVEPKPHDLPESRPSPRGLALGPDPWDGVSRLGVGAERLVEQGAVSHDGLDLDLDRLAPYLSHDGDRIARPSEHELERARRAVAKIVADLAPQPGAFDAVCERLIAVGEPMAQTIATLERDAPDYEKLLGVDLLDRLSGSRITEAGLEVMNWIRWVFSALDQDEARDDDEFFSPMAVAMASRYGGSGEDWLAVISEPTQHIELGGVVEKIALGAKTAQRRHDLLPDPDAVDRILESPQWM